MSSEKLASAQNLLKGNLAGAWDILSGAQGQYESLGIARRFGGATSAYSLRDIGANGSRVVKVRRDSGETTDPEEDFSSNQVQSVALEDWVNGKLESKLPADVDTAAAAYSLRKVKASYAEDAVRIRRSSDDAEVNVAFDSDGKVSTSSSISVISGTVSGTTLGDFINGTDAFVHTWYDQAGSNDAVQATAGNQPKIASSGSLLSDGLLFDGSNDFLQTSTQVLTGTETGANSMYAVIKQTSGDAGYICGSAANPSGSDQVGQSLYSASNDKIALTNGNDATATGTLDTITRIEGSNYLVSSNYSNNNSNTLHSNSNANGYADGSSAYDFNAGDRFTIGARKDSTSAAAVLFDGSMKEIIAYDSDQTDNRFKIESNINNYYNLYNDENEFASDETAFRFLNERSGGVSASSDLTKFTLDVQTASGYAGAKFPSDVTSGIAIYVSFNCSFDSGSPSPKIALRNIDSTLSGTVHSNEENVKEGFNSFTLTSNNNNASGIVWSEGDDNVIFTITDIKVSRIARNGFVETWYDQSGNGRTMVQATAADQPHIVENGGICKDPSGNNPTIKFVNVGTNLGSTFLKVVTPSLVPTLPDAMTQFFVASTSVDPTGDRFTFAGSDSDSCIDDRRLELRRGAGGTAQNKESPSLELQDLTNSIMVFKTNSSKVPTFHLNNSSDSASAFTGTMNEDGFEVLGENSSAASNDTFGLQGTISEAILYNIDLDTEITTLKNEINNYYNCY